MCALENALNVGIIGAGYVATAVHMPFLKGLRTANLVAVADTDPVRGSAAATHFAVQFHTSDYRTLLRNEEIRVIDICTPPESHAQIATEALEAGKDVIVEKPLAMNLEEYAPLSRTLAQATNSHLGVVLNLRYMPLVHSMVQALHSGQLGEIRNVSAVVHTAAPKADWFASPTLSRYGVLYDYVPHIIDLVLWALQAHPTSVQCMSSSDSGQGFYLFIKLSSPLVGECSFLVDAAWTSATSIRSVQFWGAERDLALDLQDQFWFLARGHLNPMKRAEEFGRRGLALTKRAAGGRRSIRYGAMVYHKDLLSDFIASFAARRCPRVSLADGFSHVAVLGAAVRSHVEGRAVTVPAEPVI